MKGKVNLKTVIVLVIMILVVVLGVLGMNTAKVYMSGASADTEPKGVLATPAEGGRSATISWSSDKGTAGVVEYGTTPASLLLRALEPDQVTDHKVVLSPLKANTNYYFRIKIGEEIYDNSGIPYSFKTSAGGSETAGGVSPTPTLIPMPTLAILSPMPTTGAILSPSPATGSGTIGGATPTTAAPATSCNRTTDYNRDGVVNSIDYFSCMNGGASAGGSTPATGSPIMATPTTTSGTQATNCNNTTVDYDGNGVVNSFDRQKCLQSIGR